MCSAIKPPSECPTTMSFPVAARSAITASASAAAPSTVQSEAGTAPVWPWPRKSMVSRRASGCDFRSALNCRYQDSPARVKPWIKTMVTGSVADSPGSTSYQCTGISVVTVSGLSLAFRSSSLAAMSAVTGVVLICTTPVAVRSVRPGSRVCECSAPCSSASRRRPDLVKRRAALRTKAGALAAVSPTRVAASWASLSVLCVSVRKSIGTP